MVKVVTPPGVGDQREETGKAEALEHPITSYNGNCGFVCFNIEIPIALLLVNHLMSLLCVS